MKTGRHALAAPWRLAVCFAKGETVAERRRDQSNRQATPTSKRVRQRNLRNNQENSAVGTELESAQSACSMTRRTSSALTASAVSWNGAAACRLRKCRVLLLKSPPSKPLQVSRRWGRGGNPRWCPCTCPWISGRYYIRMDRFINPPF